MTSTLLNLFVLPSLYLRFGKSKRAAFAIQLAPLNLARWVAESIKVGDLLWGPRRSIESDSCVSLPLCCDEPRDDAGDHDEYRALGH